MTVSWKESINEILMQFRFEPADYLTLIEIEKLFRAKHDGPYDMSWCDNMAGSVGQTNVVIKFHKQSDITWWMLQNV